MTAGFLFFICLLMAENTTRKAFHSTIRGKRFKLQVPSWSSIFLWGNFSQGIINQSICQSVSQWSDLQRASVHTDSLWICHEDGKKNMRDTENKFGRFWQFFLEWYSLPTMQAKTDNDFSTCEPIVGTQFCSMGKDSWFCKHTLDLGKDLLA